MSNDPADAAAKALVAYWRREEMDATRRLVCGRLAQSLGAETRAALAAAARAVGEGSVARVARALRGAAADDWMTGCLVRAVGPASAGVRVHVAGDGNRTTVAGGDIITGGGDPRRGGDDDASRDVVMIAAADPTDLAALRLGVEVREIEERIRLGVQRERWEVQVWLAARLADLTQGLLEGRPRILHFSGHGNRDDGIFLEDADGQARPVSQLRLRGMFSALPEKPECVVLNSCFSEPQACAIAKEVPYVIGTAGEVPDDAAILFSRGFYQAIAAGCPVPRAYEMGCVHWHDAEYADYPLPRLVTRGDAR
jgi:hypothetical protein